MGAKASKTIKSKRVLYVSRPFEAVGQCSGCRLCECMCSLENEGVFNPFKSRIRVVDLRLDIDIPVTCQQCQDAPCLSACPVEAIIIDKKLLIPVVKKEDCIGCGRCVGACPFGMISLNPETQTAFKCELCGGDPVCVRVCPSRVLHLADHLETQAVRQRYFASQLFQEQSALRPVSPGEI